VVKKAFDAGVGVIVLSKEYCEMRLENLKAVGRALKDM
jgi:hypothetical protein